MLTRRAFAISLTAAASLATPRAAAHSAPLRPDQAFQSLKALTGDSQRRTEGGHSVLVTYRLIALDSVLVETWTMSPTRNSMTVYHMDGDALIATHYCPQGNQPRIEYRPEFSGQRLETPLP